MQVDFINPNSFTEHCLLIKPVTEYYFVAQGKTTIPNVDDDEEMRITDVRSNITSALVFFLVNQTKSNLYFD